MDVTLDPLLLATEPMLLDTTIVKVERKEVNLVEFVKSSK
jgi:hypothetical protein